MKKILYFTVMLMAFMSTTSCTSSKHKEVPKEEQKTKLAENPDWKLSMQSYTLHRFNAVEALEKTEQLGLKYIEIYPGQKMGPEFNDKTFGYDLDQDDIYKIKEIAESKGIKIVSSGVWVAKRDEWEKVFDFAKKMDLEFISAEPDREDWDVVEDLAVKNNIKVAVHNHPNVNSYWKPEILLDIIDGRSNLLGSSADIGHYKRMDLDAVESVKKLEGKIISFHFKDIKPMGEEGTLEDVVWGTGILNVKEIMVELKRQNFKGYFTIEYESNWENNLPEIKESIDYFYSVLKDIN